MEKKKNNSDQNIGGLIFSKNDRQREIYAKTLRKYQSKKRTVLRDLLQVHRYRQQRYTGYNSI